MPENLGYNKLLLEKTLHVKKEKKIIGLLS